MANVLDIAKFLIFLKNHDPRQLELSNLKLQKLLYYCQGYFLSLNNNGRPLFEEDIEAWKYGPVIKEVYHTYKVFGDLDINIQVEEDDFNLELEEMGIVALVWRKFGELRAGTLVDMTHSESPWLNSWYFNKESSIISTETIADYFRKNPPQELLMHRQV
ncbi:Panacea domain-containing protein [Bacillus dakarensis]|uniref:Panacea domain-containing protein n=1 Tax=Robertmurraya dakarensis TaxID=1926278 RepID=UPI00098269C0|nr:type II toxin-antitoxin system antitoxin SocA domain-containing protein [Bacillus dakarensis]